MYTNKFKQYCKENSLKQSTKNYLKFLNSQKNNEDKETFLAVLYRAG